MKREFLKELDLGEGAKLPDNAVEAIMAEHGKTKQQLEQTISTLQNQLKEKGYLDSGYEPGRLDDPTMAAVRAICWDNNFCKT